MEIRIEMYFKNLDLFYSWRFSETLFFLFVVILEIVKGCEIFLDRFYSREHWEAVMKIYIWVSVPNSVIFSCLKTTNCSAFPGKSKFLVHPALSLFLLLISENSAFAPIRTLRKAN